ncbi:hypothetical protein [Paraburkholderia guartelaensis]|uniref:hypothetical protein n=1 Tax=Paraburkholderia guartelaensis TaxID=2546446 RepID=UPI002AB60CA8|nr:hypothetical protein [Paraburkholderia guartelaensis]
MQVAYFIDDTIGGQRMSRRSQEIGFGPPIAVASGKRLGNIGPFSILLDVRSIKMMFIASRVVSTLKRLHAGRQSVRAKQHLASA